MGPAWWDGLHTVSLLHPASIALSSPVGCVCAEKTLCSGGETQPGANPDTGWAKVLHPVVWFPGLQGAPAQNLTLPSA